MRLPRFVLALALIGTPIATVAVTATSASATSVQSTPSPPLSFSAISISARTLCALSTEGDLMCWGENRDRWVFGNITAQFVYKPTPIRLPNGQKWKSIDAGDWTSSCGLSESNRAWCWGESGIGKYFVPASRTPVEVDFADNVQLLEVQSGAYVSCGLTTARELWCWGISQYIGDGNIDTMRVPVRVPMPDNNPVQSFDAGGSNTCAITTGQNMYCWGNNAKGAFGLGYSQQYPYTFSWRPVLIPAPAQETWSLVRASGAMICGITVSGRGYCAGDNYHGSFGDGTYDDSMRFRQMQVPDNEQLIDIALGAYHTCTMTVTSKMWCFGLGDKGQLGTGTTLDGRIWRTPVIPTDARIVAIEAGMSTSCALDAAGRVFCFGEGHPSVRGTGRLTTGSLFPEQIAPVGRPAITGTGTSALEAESATVIFHVNPRGFRTTAVLEVSTSPEFVESVRHSIPTAAPDDAYIPTVMTRALWNLAPRVTHYARVHATNQLGSVTGETFTFTTLGAEPEVSSVTATGITGNEAIISASVHPNRLATTARFEYSPDPTFTNGVVSVPVDTVLGNVNQARQASADDLAPNTTYHARVVATNRLGTTVGASSTFTTVGSLPSVSSLETSATARTISLSFSLDTGLARGEAVVEYSTSASFANPVRAMQFGFTSRGSQQHSFTVFGLQPRTDYWIRVVATNGVGVSTSAALPQRTRGGKPVVSIPSIRPDGRMATVNVTYEATGLETQVVLQVSRNSDMSGSTEYFVANDSSDGANTVPVQVFNLSPRITYYATVRATNAVGTTFTATTPFTMPSLVGVLINDDDESTNSTTVRLSITAAPGALAFRVANNALFNNARVFPAASPITWELLASEGGEVERTVFVQVIYRHGIATFNDSIILRTADDYPDEDAPVIEAVRVSRASATAQGRVGASAAAPSISITARDRRSGVSRIEVRASGRTIVARVDPLRRGTHTVALPRGSRNVQVRVRDAVGNTSRWRTFNVR